MAKIRNPEIFSASFGIEPAALASAGVLDPVLNVDTRLFIDPLLLSKSAIPEISGGAHARFRAYFAEVVRLLKADRGRRGPAWREAGRRLTFPEVRATCLGYGAATIRGSAFGPAQTAKLLATAEEIVALGVDDPDMFVLIPLLEEGIGPDLISDLTANVIQEDLASLTSRIAIDLAIPTETFEVGESSFALPRNPCESLRTPVLLVARDVLRELPVASDWSEVADITAHNQALRTKVSRLIGNIWSARTRKDKRKLRQAALASRENIQTLLDSLHSAKVSAYDISSDPHGLLTWRLVREQVVRDFPLSLTAPAVLDDAGAIAIVEAIVAQFRQLVEQQGLWRLMWHRGRHHGEKVAQMIFFAIADAYCRANGLPMTPEAETGNGPVDFKFGVRYDRSILVEVKLSSNPSVVRGYTKQLEAYKAGALARDATYLVIDVGGMGRKWERLRQVQLSAEAAGENPSRLEYVDARRRKPASKRRE